MPNKKAYFQGGGGINEPTPGQKKYKSDPAIVVQPRFEEPFYRNYDLYTIPGMEEIGPGTGWHGLQNYKSVVEFLEARRERLKPRYVADDSWQIDNGDRVKKKNQRQARMSVFEKIIKIAKRDCKDSDIEYTDRRDAYICGNCLHMTENCDIKPKPTAKELHAGENHNTTSIDWRNDAPLDDPKYLAWKKSLPKPNYNHDENDGSNYDYGDGAYTAMSEGNKMKTITDAPHNSPGSFFTNADHMLPPKEHGTHIYDWKNSPYQGKPKIPKQLKKNIQKSDDNDIDFPIDDMVNHHNQMIVPIEDEYEIRKERGDKYVFPSDGDDLNPGNLNISMTSPQIAGEHSYLPDADLSGRSNDALNFGRDYDDGEEMPLGDSLKKIEDKYLTPSETDLFGLPDGIDPISDLDGEQTINSEDPFTGISDIGNQMYEDKWNI